jgi:hypothetical protein
MTTAEHRKHIPIGVKLHAALLLLGFTDDEIVGGVEWDHAPALALRIVDPVTGEMSPHPNDPRYIQPLRQAAHDLKTFGRPATTAGSDIGNAAKLKRIEREQADFRARILAKQPGQKRPRTGSIPSRPFQRRHP